MAYDKENLIDNLNDLLTRNYDAEQGFIEAGMHVNNAELVRWFNTNAANRKNFQHELKAHIIALGGEPNEGTSIAGELHQAWMDWKTYFVRDETKEMFEECLRGEDKALEDYQEVMDDLHAPAATKELIAKHIAEIKSSIKNLRLLENMFVPVEVD